MSKFICSCGILFGDCKHAFDQTCKVKGHILHEVNDLIYGILFTSNEQMHKFKLTIQKRNRNIAFLKRKIVTLETEIRTLKS